MRARPLIAAFCVLAAFSDPVGAELPPLDHLLDVYLSRGHFQPAWIVDARKNELALDAVSLPLIGVSGRPRVELSFIGSGRDAEFRPELVKVYETIDTRRGKPSDGAFEVSERVQGNRLWLVGLDLAEAKLHQDLVTTVTRERVLRAGAERDAQAAEQLKRAEESAGAEDFAALIAKLRGGLSVYRKPVAGGATLTLSMPPRYDDGYDDDDRIFRLELAAFTRTGDALNWEQSEDRLVLTCEQDGRLLSLKRSKIESRRVYGDLQAGDAERAELSALISDYARLLGMRILLGR